MTTPVSESPGNLDKLNANLARIEELTQRLIQALAQKKVSNPSLEGPDASLFIKTASTYWSEAMQDPAKFLEQQIAFWGKSLTHYVEAQQVLASGKLQVPSDPTPKDRRFSNPLWDSHPYFNFIKQQYLMNVEALNTAIAQLENVEPMERKRIEHFARQIMDMMAPTNFLGTNPDALERAVETEGASLVKGLENLIRDIESNRGELLVTLADKDAFKVGQNIGATPGSVVFRNRMIELIQYKPTTEKVHETPIVIFPPWINKFYILDLKPANSLIKWLVDQGFTLFVVSWKNPDAGYADVGMDTYVEEGYLAAIEEVKAITGQKKVNAVGYCIAGTTLSLTLSILKQRGDKSVNSATFFTTLTDFADPGEVGVYLSDDFIDAIEAQVARRGYLDRYFMSKTFSYLRANDLVYAPAIRSYMMGEAPPAFDLLFWNGDGTNLPARMSVEYLRGLCVGNGLADAHFQILGHTVSLKDITIPVCSVACEADHIAPWLSCYDGFRKYGSKDKTFILSESGHIAGIVNPPTKDKYGHYVNEADPTETPSDLWRETAEYHRGSWWPRWKEWLSKRSGKMVDAREPGDSKHKILAPAPGTYVSEVPNI